MIIKYGTTENVEVVNSKNIPSWVNAAQPDLDQTEPSTDTEDDTEEKE